ncbi:MAG: N-glycosylase/DNA lyase [Candidatus Aenigmarchaeota archaeon]|nr:N-glycosylase/DNA lyase [Candidatus Aenigmarchaeota archaeon]
MSLADLYKERRREIAGRLADFELMRYRTPKELFPEFCFCLLTPGTKASLADEVVRQLAARDLLFTGSVEQIAPLLAKRVRFYNTKAKRIVQARSLFTDDTLRTLFQLGDNKKMREWLVANVKGLGWKEASHFLRNVGRGEDLAIIDRHILRNLREQGIIDAVPGSLTRKRYLDIEGKVREFSRQVGIPMQELDLLLWSKETGRIFK